MPTDYYEVLGVPKDANAQDIKKAYRQVMRECHPDVAGEDPAAQERYTQARSAYDTLIDPVTRARYDRRGQRRKQGFGAKGGSFFDAFYKATGNSSSTEKPVKGGRMRYKNPRADPRNHMGLDDLFNVGEFGFGSNVDKKKGERPRVRSTSSERPMPAQGDDVQLEVQVPTDVAARGGSVTAVYHRMQRDSSWRPGQPGDGRRRVQDVADIRIIPGTRQGATLRERNLGDAGPFAGPYGDLLVVVRLVAPARKAPTPAPSSPGGVGGSRFTSTRVPLHRGGPTSSSPPSTGSGRMKQEPRRPPPTPKASTPTSAKTRPPSQTATPPAPPGPSDVDVQILNISVVEALLGGRVEVETPKGKVRMTLPPGTSGGTRMRLKGKGKETASGPRDLYVEVRIDVPKNLDVESRRLIEQFALLNPE